jgi:hypothetical protein
MQIQVCRQFGRGHGFAAAMRAFYVLFVIVRGTWAGGRFFRPGRACLGVAELDVLGHEICIGVREWA